MRSDYCGILDSINVVWAAILMTELLSNTSREITRKSEAAGHYKDIDKSASGGPGTRALKIYSTVFSPVTVDSKPEVRLGRRSRHVAPSSCYTQVFV